MDQYKKRIHLKNTEIGSLNARLGKVQRELEEMTRNRDIWKGHFETTKVILSEKIKELEFENKALKASEAFADYYRKFYKDQYEALLDQVVPGMMPSNEISEGTQTALDNWAKAHLENVAAQKEMLSNPVHVTRKDDALDALRYSIDAENIITRGEAMGMMDAISCSMQEASDHIKKPEIVGISSDDKKPPYFDLDD